MIPWLMTLILLANGMMEIAKGNFSAAETFFLQYLPMARKRLELVNINYLLALCFSGMGKAQKAAQAYTYVAENGGTTWYAGAARQALAHIQAQPQETEEGK